MEESVESAESVEELGPVGRCAYLALKELCILSSGKQVQHHTHSLTHLLTHWHNWLLLLLLLLLRLY